MLSFAFTVYCAIMQASSSNIIVGSQVWVEDTDDAWIDGEVLEVIGENIKVSCHNGNLVSALFVLCGEFDNFS